MARGEFYSEAEETLLRSDYPRFGFKAMWKLLPHRSFDGLRSKIAALGLKRDSRKKASALDLKFP